MIIDTLIILLFGFPGALLFMPFTYYLKGSSALGGIVMLLPLFQIGSAAAVFRKKRTLAWLLLMPAIFTVLWVVGVVIVYS